MRPGGLRHGWVINQTRVLGAPGTADQQGLQSQGHSTGCLSLPQPGSPDRPLYVVSGGQSQVIKLVQQTL